jgi:1-acyl-sn-glycerol-3-phosphate acyltransferase
MVRLRPEETGRTRKMSDSNSSAGNLSRGLVRRFVRLYYPRIEIDQAEPLPADAQILFVSNHANSLIDPVIIGVATRRPIHYLAKAPMFDVPVMGQILKALGMIPAFRGSDDKTQVRRNLESLDVAAKELGKGKDVGIFPEGKSHDETHVEQVRSGAARIALKAVQEGAKKLLIVPIGLNYEAKEKFRSGVWVRIGKTIDVNAWLADHDGNERKAMRSLTTRIDGGLKEVVIHLDNADWEPYLGDLEGLEPESQEAAGDPIAALRHRKRLADGINYFMAEDPDRARSVAGKMRQHREDLKAAGLTVRSPAVRYRSLWVGWLLLRQTLLLFGGLIPWTGTLFHLAPFAVVRLLTGWLSPPGKMTTALYRLFIGVPIYGLWYALAWRWLNGYFMPWIAWAACFLMPFAGLWALDYCRRARDTVKLWWSEFGMLFRRKRLTALRGSQRKLSEELEEMSGEHRRAKDIPPSPRRLVSGWWVARRYLLWAVCVVAAVVFAALAYGWFKPTTIPELAQPAPDLSLQTARSLDAPLEADERTLRELLGELDRLSARVGGLRARFEKGELNFFRQEDNDAIRRSMMTYIACRTGLLRIAWKYQNFEQIEDPASRLRAMTLAVTAASSTFNASLTFVTDFMDSPDAVRKLNEAEPLWSVPEGLFDRVHRNLLNDEFRDRLKAAHLDYLKHGPEFEANKMGVNSSCGIFHRTIRANIASIEARYPRLSGAKLDVAIKEVKGLGKDGVYRAQTFISLWIGKARVRAPRKGQTLIQPEHLAELQPRLQPGDILIERRNWVLSNAFLPGFWPHAALYIGTPEEIEKLGIKDDDRVKDHWKTFTSKDAEGHERVIIEALAAGVDFSSFEHSVGEADAVCVFRPKVSEADRRESLARAFSHLNKPYDFEFDFFSTDKLVCTELIFRAYDGKIDFPLVKVMGTTTLPAMELIRKFEKERGTDDAQLEFVGFLDGDESAGTAGFKDADALIKSLDRSSFTWMQALGGK